MSEMKNVSPSPPWEPGTRLIATVLMILLAVFLLFKLQQLVVVMVLSFLLTYILFPIVRRTEQLIKGPRWLAVLLVFTVILILIVAAGTGAGVAISESVVDLIDDLGKLAANSPELFSDLLTSKLFIGPWVFDLNELNLEPAIEQLSKSVQGLLLQTGTILASVASGAATAIGLGVMVFVVSFYLLMDIDKADKTLLNLVPKRYRADIRRLMVETGEVWQSFFRGQIILGLVIGSAVALMMSLIGLKFSVAIGVIAGLLEFIPMFGPFISTIIAVLIGLFQESNWLGLSPGFYCLVIIGAFLLIQQLENNILVPRIIGGSLNLHPLIVLLAVFAGGIIGGLLGVLIAAPLVATLRLWLGYVYRKTVGLETWPAPAIGPLQKPKQSLAKRLLNQMHDHKSNGKKSQTLGDEP